jgi:hypothetical protein
MPEIRPDLQPAYESLCYQGQQFPEPHEVTQLDGVTLSYQGENIPVEIDRQALALQGETYVGDPDLREALQAQGIKTSTWEEATNLLGQYLAPESDSLVWGFSGYATGGVDSATGSPFSYEDEANGLLGLYDYLAAKDELPRLAIDGGVSEGFLALNSVIAQSAGVRTLGFIPKEGLASVGIRDDLVVAGETYRDREKAVGTADVLVCAGGKGGTARECIRAIKGGAAALILDLKDYPLNSLPHTFSMDKDLRQAYEDRRLVVCKTLDEIPERVDQILQVDVKRNRPLRNRIVTDFLTPGPNGYEQF